MVVDDNASIAIEYLPPRRNDRERFNAIPLGLLTVYFRTLDLELPEAGDEEQENRYGDVLKSRQLGGRKTGIVAQAQFARRFNVLTIGLGFDGRKRHGRPAGSLVSE
jgi:hypothetical protein